MLFLQGAKDRYYQAFLDYIRSERKDEAAEIVDISDEELGNYFKMYFFTMQVRRKIKNNDGVWETKEDWPKLKTAEWIKSMIKCSVYEKDRIDLSDSFRFPNGKKNWGSFVEKLKDESK